MAVDIASFVLAVLGFGLAVASLVWQYVTFLQSGGVAEVVLKVGIRTAGFQVLSTAAVNNAADLRAMVEQHGGTPVAAVCVRNVGRMAITVTSWGFKNGAGQVLSPVGDAIGPRLKHTIAPGDEETWMAPIQNAVFIGEAQGIVDKQRVTTQVRAVVDLADGRTVTSKNGMTVETDRTSRS